MPGFSIRPYQRADRALVHTIGADTAFFGEPVEALMEDRRLYCDLFYAYYTDLEPEHAWVACMGNRVVGFLAGCVDPSRQRWGIVLKVVPKALLRILRRQYRLGQRTWRFAVSLVGAFFRREIPRQSAALYPAHLHVNVARPWRARGLGRLLLEACLQQLRLLKVRGVHLHTTSRNAAACRLYRHLGFRLLDSRPTRIWARALNGPVENRCYVLRLR